VVILILSGAASICDAYEPKQKQVPLNYWELTRNSAVVLKGTVKNVNAYVTLTVSLLLKGEMESETVKFATPKITEGIQFVDCFPRVPRFAVGKQYLVFLNKNEAGEYVFVNAATDNLMTQTEQSIRDLQRFDNLDNDIEKCKMLVNLMVLPHKGLRSSSATQEIYKFNKAEFLELLEPLVDDPITKATYVSLLGQNPNPDATYRLRELLKEAKQKNLLIKVISALQRKRPEDDKLSKELLKYIKHESSEVRRTVIFALKYRDFRDAIDEVAIYLEDEDPNVRSTALYYLGWWPKSKDVLAKIEKLKYDSNEHVRAAAYNALPLQASSFYEFFSVSLLDKSKNVRSIAGRLDLLWERKPLIISSLLLWPCIVVSAIVFYVLRVLQWSRPGLTVAVGIAAGYIAGVFTGYLTGKYHSTGPIFCAFILIPPLVMPMGVLLAVAVSKYGRKIPIGLFLLLIIVLCVIVRMVTLSNTLWPSILTGFFIMTIIICLSDFGLQNISLKVTMYKRRLNYEQ
jgi:HEAT repeat protein